MALIINMCDGTSELCIHFGVAQVPLESLQGHKVSTSNRVIINFYSIYNLNENHKLHFTAKKSDTNQHYRRLCFAQLR